MGENPVCMAVDKCDNAVSSDRKDTGLSLSPETRCHANVKLRLETNNRWYLKASSNLQHSFHEELPPESNLLGESDLNKEEMSWIETMYRNGISNGIIASVMTGYFDKEGKTQGEFLATTIDNLTKKIQKECDAVKNISPDMTVAEKTLKELDS